MRPDILVVVVLMLLPLIGTGGLLAYIYWAAVTGIYIIYIGKITKRWVE